MKKSIFFLFYFILKWEKLKNKPYADKNYVHVCALQTNWLYLELDQLQK